ncbi:MAG: TRAP transporter small permease [Victivallales bacterium]|nr:TRAP transporter small permease [Victivallales bacterium]
MFQKLVVFLVRVLALVACLGAMAMIVVTCLDVVLRQFGHPLLGVVDIVQITACIAGSCALPYTTATKGHVAVEFFFQRLPRRAKIVIDGMNRGLVAIMFLFLSWRCWVYGLYMLRKNIGTMTLQLPLFWVMWLMAFSFLVVVLVKIQHLLHPGKEMMKA